MIISNKKMAPVVHIGKFAIVSPVFSRATVLNYCPGLKSSHYENFCGFFSTVLKAIQTNWCISSSVDFNLNGCPKLSCWLSKGGRCQDVLMLGWCKAVRLLLHSSRVWVQVLREDVLYWHVTHQNFKYT